MVSWLSSASSHAVFKWSHVLFTWSHIPSGGGAVNVLLHLLNLAHMFDATLYMSSLHDHTYLRVGGCYRPFALAHMFDATLYMSSLHDHTYLRVGWLLTSFCTCSHVRCYASDVFFTWSHIPSGGGAVNVLLLLLTCSMLRFRRLLYMITHSFGWGGC